MARIALWLAAGSVLDPVLDVVCPHIGERGAIIIHWPAFRLVRFGKLILKILDLLAQLCDLDSAVCLVEEGLRLILEFATANSELLELRAIDSGERFSGVDIKRLEFRALSDSQERELAVANGY